MTVSLFIHHSRQFTPSPFLVYEKRQDKRQKGVLSDGESNFPLLGFCVSWMSPPETRLTGKGHNICDIRTEVFSKRRGWSKITIWINSALFLLRAMLSPFFKTANRVSRYMKCHFSFYCNNDTLINTLISSCIMNRFFSRNLLWK